MDDIRRARRVDVAGDLELLAHWLPVIEGRAGSLEKTPSARAASDGRGDFVDGHHRRLREALRVRDRLQRLRAKPGGERHVLVLEFVYVTSGEEWRRRADPRLDGGGVAEAVGRRFALPEVIAQWDGHRHRSLRRALPRRHGQGLLDAAVAAYTQLALEEDAVHAEG